MKRRKWLTCIFAVLLGSLTFLFVGCSTGTGNVTSIRSEGSEENESSSQADSVDVEENPQETHWGDDGELKILMIGISGRFDAFRICQL